MSPESLYREHGPGVFRVLVRLSGDPEQAADVLHDTFQRLMERPPRHDSNVRGWLLKVATNRLRDVQRTSTRHATALSRLGPRRTVGDPGQSPDRTVAVLDARKTVATIMAELPERDRTILLLREEGYTHREIAAAVGTTTGSVGTMIARALTRVARLVAQQEITP